MASLRAQNYFIGQYYTTGRETIENHLAEAASLKSILKQEAFPKFDMNLSKSPCYLSKRMALYDQEREVGMGSKIALKMEDLKEAPLKVLQAAYTEQFPGKKVSNNRTYLWRRLAYRLQELEHGELPAKAKVKLKALMDAYDPVNNVALKPRAAVSDLLPERDRRLPLPGTIITKDYKGTKIQVKTLDDGFEYNGKIYRSLTAIAKEITGAHWNGFLFFNL